MYQFIRTLNNNAVLAINQGDNSEVILMGKGIGFRSKDGAGELINDDQVEKAFVSLDQQWKSEYLELIETVDEEVMSVCSEIILKARESLGELHPSLFVVLSGHINFAIQRLKNSIVIENPLLYEIQVLYPREYAAALAGKSLLEKRLKLPIMEEEAGYIALHLNAAKMNQNVKASLQRTNLMGSLMDLAEKSMKVVIDDYKIARRQLADHLKGVLERLEAQVDAEHPLLQAVKEQLPHEFHAAETLADILKDYTQRNVPQGEIAYMACHLFRMRALCERK